MMAPIQYNLCGRAKHLNYFLWGEVLRFFLTKNVTKGTKELKIVGMSLFFMTLRKVFRICTKTVHFQQENSEGIQVLVYFHTDFEKKANNFVFV